MKPATRFSCVRQASGSWSVLDEETGVPAALDGKALEGLAEQRARAACGILGRIYRSRLDAPSTRARHRRDGTFTG